MEGRVACEGQLEGKERRAHPALFVSIATYGATLRNICYGYCGRVAHANRVV